jgi:nicotinamidase-related amidase
MATVREGTDSVLVIVDVQVAVMKEAWDSQRIISNVATAVREARSNGVPVIWVQHSDDQLPAGSPEWEWVPGLSPNSDETVISKQFVSSFEETDLEQVLDDLKASHIVLAGAATNFCIRATAYGALDRGYDLTLISDAHTTGTMELNGTTINAADIIADLNAVMSWIKYPGRINKAVPTSEADFANLGL